MLGLYAELIWPGRILPGVGGLLVALAGIGSVARMQLHTSGLTLLGVSVGLFLLKAFWNIDFIARLGGTAALSVGFHRLIGGAAPVPLILDIPVCLIFGGITLLLCREEKRARRNKRLDLAEL